MSRENGILIVGTTPQGLQAALILARCGRKVVLAEKGRETGTPFPGWGEQGKRWCRYLRVQAARHPLIEILTETDVVEMETAGRGVAAKLVQRPRWVLPDLCVQCERCLPACPVELSNGQKPLIRLNGPTSMAIDKREPAPCRSACPLDMNPQGYAALISRGRFEEAYHLILEKNPLPGICGRVCHHPCESVCRRRDIDEPVAIGALKRFAADWARKKQMKPARKGTPANEGPRVAVVGSGPAGLTAAHDLAGAGFRPTLIDACEKPGGLLTEGIAPYRLPREIVEEEIAAILGRGVDFRSKTPVRSWGDIERLKAEGFRAVLLATGASRDLRMNIPGEALEGVHGCVSFLNRLWRGETLEPPGRVVVIGGGNAAVEAARACVRSGARSVHLLYRRTRKEMPADPHEIRQALEEGVRLRPLAVPVEFVGDGNRLIRIRCMKMRPGDPDGSGRRRPIPVEGSDFLIRADTAVVSVGQEGAFPYGTGGDLGFAASGTIEIGNRGETNIPGVYAAGDAVSGPSTVVEAMASGRRAALGIIADLTPGERPFREGDALESPLKDYDPVPKDIPKKRRMIPPHRDIGPRTKDFGEVIGPFREKTAIEEASRCLNCGVCSECLRCEAACDLGAIRHDREGEERTLFFDAVMVADAPEPGSIPDRADVIRIHPLGKRASWERAVATGRAAALEALSKGPPAPVEREVRKGIGREQRRIGVFICSCNGSLDEDGGLAGLISLLKGARDVVHAEIVTSACHPEKGRRIEEAVESEKLSGAVIAACACCSLDFACESCTDQRIRLKERLFRGSGYERGDLALVNIRETGLLAFKDDRERAIRGALGVVRAGLLELKESGAWVERGEKPDRQAVVLGATEFGVAAAVGLKESYPSVILLEDRVLEKGVEEDLRRSGVQLVRPARPAALAGHRGAFTLIFERPRPVLHRSGDLRGPSVDGRGKGPEEKPGYHRIGGEIIVLGRREFRKMPYKRDAFTRTVLTWSRETPGTLGAGIPGVYMASRSLVRGLPDSLAGMSAAAEVLEKTPGEAGSPGFPAASVDAALCRGCGRCGDVCREGAVRLSETDRGVACSRIEARFCTACGNCLAECPTGAVRLPGSEQDYLEKVMNAFLE